MREDATELTGAEYGLSTDEQMKIALQCMSENGGAASMSRIYKAVEAHIAEHRLSRQGKDTLRHIVNSAGVKKGYVFPFEPGQSSWRITPEGMLYIQGMSGEGTEAETYSEIITEPYDPSKIKVELKPFSVFQVMRKLERGEINLQPEFQRNVVWDEVRQSRLIESILIRLPLPTFYLDAANDDNWLVVDGLQRLWTLDLYCNRRTLKLRDLEFLKEEAEGHTFDTLPRSFQRQIEETILNLYIIQPETPPRVKFTIFSRVNTGGLVLTAQEIRHSLFQGEATTLLKDLAESPAFVSATTGSIPSKRMEDREAVLRFLAFYVTPYTKYLKSDLDGFLSDAMKSINELDSHSIDELRSAFNQAMDNAKLLFERQAFRKIYDRSGLYRYPINKSLFEVWAVLLAKVKSGILAEYKEAIVDEFIRIVRSDSEFLKAISQSTNSVRSVQTRFSTVERLLRDTANVKIINNPTL